MSLITKIKFSYECGCIGAVQTGKVEICCPSHGDLLCVNGKPLDMMKIDASALDLLMADGLVPSHINLNKDIPCP